MTAAAKTDTFVRLIAATLLAWLAVDRLPWYWAVVALTILAWESWALVNKELGDTFSEAYWRLNDRTSLAPWAVGFLDGLAYVNVHDRLVFGAVMFISAHLVFPRYGRVEVK